MEKHLTFWEEGCDLSDFQRWCGNYQKDFKIYTRKHIKEKEYKSVLDVGAGVFSEYHGFKNDGINIKYVATEITKKYINLGQQQGIEVYECSTKKMPFEDNSYDVVISHHVLNHQKEFKESIKEMLRVAKKEVIITFFKPFMEEMAAKQELSNCTFFREEISGLGIVLHRFVNEKEQPTCIYTFFSINAIKDFLEQSGYNYSFGHLEGERFLFITKFKPSSIR